MSMESHLGLKIWCLLRWWVLLHMVPCHCRLQGGGAPGAEAEGDHTCPTLVNLFYFPPMFTGGML